MRAFLRSRRALAVALGTLTLIATLAVIWWPDVVFAGNYAASWVTSHGGERDLTAAQQRLEETGAGKLPLAGVHIVIRKGERRLELCDADRVIKSFPIALGGNPSGQKEREGDGRTPEGTYRLCARVNPSRYHLFLGLSYPNTDDAARGADALSDDERRAIEQADAKGGKPPWNTALGGAVGIHGGGTHRDWTHGCIALANRDIEELYTAVTDGTDVTILP